MLSSALTPKSVRVQVWVNVWLRNFFSRVTEPRAASATTASKKLKDSICPDGAPPGRYTRLRARIIGSSLLGTIRVSYRLARAIRPVPQTTVQLPPARVMNWRKTPASLS